MSTPKPSRVDALLRLFGLLFALAMVLLGLFAAGRWLLSLSESSTVDGVIIFCGFPAGCLVVAAFLALAGSSDEA